MVHVFIIYLLLILPRTMYQNDDDDDDSREFQNVNTTQLSLWSDHTISFLYSHRLILYAIFAYKFKDDDTIVFVSHQ